MGKTSKPTPAPFYNGSVSVNGEKKASSYLENGTVHSNYNMSDTEKAIYDYAQNELLSNLGKVNTFSKDTIKNMNNQLNAYKQKGENLIYNTYTPMINNLKTDIASRFGNFDNSSFLNKLNAIESNRASAINSLAQDMLTKQKDLVNDELSRRYNYLNFMNDLQNQTTNNILNYLNASNANSSAGHNYGNNSSSSSTDYLNLASDLIEDYGPILSAVASFFAAS